MSIDTLALSLYKANIEFQLRIINLLQVSGHQWLASVQQTSAEYVSQTKAKIDSLVQSASWPELATLPSESFWRVFQQQSSDVQLANQLAVKNQAIFASGLQQALDSWQKSVVAVVGDSRSALPMQDVFNQWGEMWMSPLKMDAEKKPAA